MRILDLFSGIGGFSLGLEACGMATAAFCECEPYARSILARHWPTVPIYDDVRTLTADRLVADGVGPIDLVCGGFPCQDVSTLGKGRGVVEGTRSGLWIEYARIIGELRPRWVLVENSPMLRTRGADRVLGGLEAIGYSAWPLVVGAVSAGAHHRRRRAWIVAHAHGVGEVPKDRGQVPQVGLRMPSQGRPCPRPGGRRLAPSEVLRTSDGVPDRAYRVSCLGNAVVPKVVEMIGRAILAVEAELAESRVRPS